MKKQLEQSVGVESDNFRVSGFANVDIFYQGMILCCLVKLGVDHGNRIKIKGEGEGEVAFFSGKHWVSRKRADLIESVTLCHDAQVGGPAGYRNHST